MMQRTLRRDIYALHNPGCHIDDVWTPDPDPLAAARYSCVYWIDHLCDSDPLPGKEMRADEDQVGGHMVDAFLRGMYLNWLEALSLAGGMLQGLYSITKLETCLLVSCKSYCCHPRC
jgi:hypothetical protein